MHTIVRTTLLAGAVAVACGAPAGAAPKPFTIASTIDGKKALPARLHWIARPSLDAAQIRQVQFLIDGRLRWVEKEAPYTYGEDDGPSLGSLVTSFLRPGMHRFTVRAIGPGGRTAERTVRARTGAPPVPPAGLAGTWQRTIADVSGAPAPGSAGNPTETFTPAGTYTLVIEPRWIQTRFPGTFVSPQSDDTGAGWILDSDYTATGGSLRALGAVTFDVFHHQAEYGWWCRPGGPPSSYTWSVAGNVLTLTPVGTEACGVRGFVWAGQWTRAG